MRMGSFLLGGMIGAATVIFMRERKRMMSGVGMMFRTSNKDKTEQNMQNVNSSQSSHEQSENLQQLEKIINSDPELRSQVDAVMKESNASTQSH